MTLYDLIFAVVALATAATLLSAVVPALRGDRPAAGRRLRLLAGALAAYLALVTVVSLVLPPRTLAPGENLCSDDWCIAVTNARRDSAAMPPTLDVRYTLTSRARGAPQRERFVVSYLIDGAGARIDAQQVSGAVPFDSLLQPGQHIEAARSFVVAGRSSPFTVVIAREGDGGFPRCCILGEGLFRQPPRVALRQDARAAAADTDFADSN
jgi:hypothetical protein